MKCNSFIDQNKRFWIFCMLCVLSVTLVFAQNISVKGYVFDKGTGDPLIGASVVQKGTQNGVVTDIDGNFVINMPVNGTLVVHYIGYKSVEVQATSAAERLRIAMEENSQMLDEVVAIGYGSAKKKDLTGSIASIRLEDSPRMSLPNMNVLDALKGQLPGLDIGTATNAGGNPSFNIRGQNSIKASNNPLIVVDGVVHLGSWNELNPSDIASVDVLKDASSAAVYGSRAANGVILVTTKRGKNEPTIRFGTTIGFQTPTTRPDMLSPEGYLQLKKDLRRMNGASEADLELQNLLTPYEYSAYQEGNIINWYDECVSMGLSQDYQLSISGGTDRLNYYVSGQFLDQDGIMYNDQFRKFSVTSKIESQVTDWMKVGLKLSVVNKNADGKEADMRNAINNTPYGYKYVRFEGFGHEMERSPQGHQTTINPLWQTRQFNEDRNQNYNSLAFARIDLPWVKGLSYTFNFSLNRWEGHGANFQDERYFMNTLDEKDLYDQTKYLVDANGSKNHSTRTDWFMNHLVNFNRAFGDHSVDLTLLAERQRATTTRSDLSAKDFKAAGSTVLGIHSLELGNPANRGINTDKTVLSQLAYMARANYAYKQRYHVSASIRRDGYSGFAEGNSKYGDFFSLAGAWTVSNEKFFRENVKLINYLKLRLSYGENGNPSVGSYSTFSKMGAGTYLFGRTTANTSASSGLANKALSWEKTGAWNIGVDFSILNDRLSGNIDYYRSKTVDLLLDRAIPVMNGFQNVSDNIGEVKNWGFEFSLRSINIETKDFSWSTGLNFWMNRNKVVSLYGLDGDKDGIEDDDIANNLFIGKSLGAVYTYVFDGIIQEKDLEYMAIYGGNPGDVKFKDLNNDGKIDANGDRKIIGYTKPNFTMTMSNTLTYKNFELYFMLNWIAGGGKDNYYIANNIYANYVGTFGGGGTANWLNKEYWMPEHPSNKVPRPNYTNPYQYQFPQRHDFLRLQDLSLAYRFDRKLLRSTPVKSLRLYVAAKNLLTFTSWEGIDPETGAAYAHGNPALRNITMGVDVTF